MRDQVVRSIPLQSPIHRIIVIGDSFTEGIGVHFDETFSGLLYKAGQEATPQFEVLNAGVSSYSPVIYYQKIKRLLDLGLRFDEVIVFSDPSDVEDEATSYFCIDDDPAYRAHCSFLKTYFVRSFDRYFRHNFSVTYRAWLSVVQAFSPPPNRRDQWPHLLRIDWSLPVTPDKARYAPLGVGGGIKRSVVNMTKLAALLAQHHIPLTVVVYPWPAHLALGDTMSRQISIWRQFCERRCKAFINLFPSFFAAKRNDKDWYNHYFINGDVHFSSAGHKLVFTQVMKQLVASPPSH